ncbi:threonine/serine exporter family protein [Salinicoccus roseus]|uniref:threonine/serine exporter family protein n=1 Tax=Salinicoccus roseus TaxID=45670 RepID=UPI00230117B8|nr:threonine/serine exporter family protein [Salinicoccus roseus]
MLLIYFYQFVLSFFASASFGVLFNAPRNALVSCGATGAFGWIVFYLFREGGTDLVLSSFLGALTLSAIAILNSRRRKMPILLFITCGIIPLVPGGLAYDAMRHVVFNEYMTALEYGFEAALISLAIAMGIISTEMADQVLQTIRRKLKREEV